MQKPADAKNFKAFMRGTRFLDFIVMATGASLLIHLIGESGLYVGSISLVYYLFDPKDDDFILFLILPVIIFGAYIALMLLANRKKGVMTAALVLYCIDLLAFIGILFYVDFNSYSNSEMGSILFNVLIDLVVHAVGIVLMAIAVKNEKKAFEYREMQKNPLANFDPSLTQNAAPVQPANAIPVSAQPVQNAAAAPVAQPAAPVSDFHLLLRAVSLAEHSGEKLSALERFKTNAAAFGSISTGVLDIVNGEVIINASPVMSEGTVPMSELVRFRANDVKEVVKIKGAHGFGIVLNDNRRINLEVKKEDGPALAQALRNTGINIP